jgi:hypothetical protein
MTTRMWIAALVLTAASVPAQTTTADKGKAAAAPAKAETKDASASAGMPSAKPGPEHQALKDLVGTWDATVEMMAPGAPPAASKGIETVRPLANGLWVVTDFKGEMMGQPFEGHGVSGYDGVKKKYVGTWVDSMTTSLIVSEGTYDAAKKTATDVMEGTGMDGKPAKWKAVTEWKDADSRVFTMYDEGKDQPSMKITYKRRK